MTRRSTAEWSPVSRRQALIGVGTLAAGSGSIAMVASTSARAGVSVESLSVADAEFTAESVTPELRVDIGFSYDAGSQPVDAVAFELVVDDTPVASEELSTTKAVYEGTDTLSGLVTDSDAWAASDFAPAVAATVKRDVSATVRFDVLDGSGDAIASDSASDTATVTVSHPQETEWMASVGGSGEIVDASE